MERIILKSRNKIVLIGAIHIGHKPMCGETMKNQLFLKRFSELFDRVVPVDTYEWKKRPLCLVKLLIVILVNPKAKYIISASGSSRFLINFFNRSFLKREVYFWVVGGDLPIAVKNGKYNIDALNSLRHILVQGPSMVDDLKALGVDNSVYVPNSKPITYLPKILRHVQDEPYRFIFLSRVHPDKGIGEIIEASSILDNSGFAGKYCIDFYGSKDPAYTAIFDGLISKKECLKYRGYLDLTSDSGYEILSTYDVMLFPTYWRGEGFPGVVLDANIAGLPIIASNWNLNAEVVEDGKTGIIIPARDSRALATAMQNVITGTVDLIKMKNECVDYVQQFDFRNVLSEEFMKRIGLY